MRNLLITIFLLSLASIVSAYGEPVNERLKLILQDVWSEYRGNSELYRFVSQKLSQDSWNNPSRFMSNAETLKKQYIEQHLQERYNTLLKKINSWFPATETFNQLFVKFLKDFQFHKHFLNQFRGLLFDWEKQDFLIIVPEHLRGFRKTFLIPSQKFLIENVKQILMSKYKLSAPEIYAFTRVISESEADDLFESIYDFEEKFDSIFAAYIAENYQPTLNEPSQGPRYVQNPSPTRSFQPHQGNVLTADRNNSPVAQGAHNRDKHLHPHNQDQSRNRFDENTPRPFPQINQGRRVSSIDVLRSKLQEWFPHFSNLNSVIIDILNSYDNKNELINRMITNEATFQDESRAFLQNMSLENKDTVRSELYRIISQSSNKPQNEKTKILDYMKENDVIKLNDVALAYDGSPVLMTKFNEASDEIDALFLLERNLNSWLSNSQDFVTKIINFAKKLNVPVKNLKNLKQKDFFKNSPFFNRFTKENSVEFNDVVYGEIEKMLRKKTRDNELIQQYLEALKERQFENEFNTETLFDLDKLERSVNAKVNEIDYENCTNAVEKQIAETFRNEKYKIFSPNLESYNKCIPHELCFKNKAHSERDLNEFFEKLLRLSDESRYDRNRKIKDEIDESIYDVIRDVLTRPDSNIVNGNCIADNMLLQNAADGFYTPELLFDEEKLMSQVSKLANEYNEKFYKK